ncbi:glycosyltransferase family 2 protein [Paenibacillus cremeus]|uniref:Glycosyltransferase family 2 protein n=1 Tax=Paenibacillus cremeus TaxID=2163881 RepID=A0A559JMC7_9BACL|nr:glycosyltransferase family A protein [Paenibacillus cremeus]TVY01034.1 glycosyltransferase family 2 protein [Paenibacillus cremeus]
MSVFLYSGQVNSSKTLGVSIITCTNRPHFFNTLLNNFKRQQYKVKELIIILNKKSMDLSEYRRKVSSFRNISIFKLPEKVSLGSCLNFGIRKAKYSVIAKFDDDDYYSPNYLKEQVGALRRTGAGIVGKGAHLKFFERNRLLVMTTPSKKNKFVKYVAGGTLLFKKQLHNRVRFASLTLGEDVNFMRKSRALGYKLFATSPYNFVGIRRKNKQSHTWKASDKVVMKGSLFVAKTTNFRKWADRPIK